MKAWLCVIGVVIAGCASNGVESGLLVTLELDPGLTSKCVQLVARVGSTERRSGGIVLTGSTTTRVAVAQGDFPDVVTLQAFGFSDEACRTLTSPAEDTLSTEARFVKNVPTTAVTLRVRRALLTGENCGNGLDDDDDQLVDCADPDCNTKSCSQGNACIVEQSCTAGSCVGGTVKKCTTPPNGCFAASGNCEAPAGTCAYSPRVDAACDDGDPCTVSDRCGATGACVGSPRMCTNPPSQCHTAVGLCSGTDGGACVYTLVEGQSCSDGNSCSIGDRCSAAGTCAGVLVSCPLKECQAFSGSCDGDGGCQYMPTNAGAQCRTTGVCNGAGSCNLPFPYTPSNVTLAQIPNTPPDVTVFNCGQTTIDTSTLPPTVTNWCKTGLPDFGAALVSQSGEQPIMVMAFKAFQVDATSSVLVKGTRGALIVVTGDATVAGPIKAEAGFRACAGGSGGNGASDLGGNGGAGGAGFGSIGGAGAKSGGGSAGGAGGTTNGDPLLVPLRGGCSGGTGGGNNRMIAVGGGALQISVGGTLTVSGQISAPGTGGLGAPGTALVVNGGNGAGSGGAILLEATIITLTDTASLTANGGSGGESSDLSANPGQSGVAGTTTKTPALGGKSRLGDGQGGNGSAGGTGANAGADFSGGGGGGVGRIRLNTTGGCSVNTSAILSPTPTTRQAGTGCL